MATVELVDGHHYNFHEFANTDSNAKPLHPIEAGLCERLPTTALPYCAPVIAPVPLTLAS